MKNSSVEFGAPDGSTETVTGIAPDLARALVDALHAAQTVEPPAQAQNFDDLTATIAQTSRLIQHLEAFRELTIVAADQTGPHADRKAIAIAAGFPPSRLYRVLDAFSLPRDRKDPEAVARPANQRQELASRIRALGGTWDAKRAAGELAKVGQVVTDKRARQLLRDLASIHLLVKIDPASATYRAADQAD
ncbi:hypothetical protein [Streptomyces sp. NPDC058084]|uniref:hypothetical protein n=1 Tax=Streptomyces sp. NPDC058084 TaxID=3346333 RepID=UPI0036E2F869